MIFSVSRHLQGMRWWHFASSTGCDEGREQEWLLKSLGISDSNIESETIPGRQVITANGLAPLAFAV